MCIMYYSMLWVGCVGLSWLRVVAVVLILFGWVDCISFLVVLCLLLDVGFGFGVVFYVCLGLG